MVECDPLQDDLEAQANRLLAKHGGFGKLPAIYTKAQLQRKTGREVSLEETWAEKIKQFEQHTGPVTLIDTLRWQQLRHYMDRATLTRRQHTMLIEWSNWTTMREIATAHHCSASTVCKELHIAFCELRRVIPSDPYWGWIDVMAETFGWRCIRQIYEL
jgi:hypothetical protein